MNSGKELHWCNNFEAPSAFKALLHVYTLPQADPLPLLPPPHLICTDWRSIHDKASPSNPLTSCTLAPTERSTLSCSRVHRGQTKPQTRRSVQQQP
jgi:hypothetical protein